MKKSKLKIKNLCLALAVLVFAFDVLVAPVWEVSAKTEVISVKSIPTPILTLTPTPVAEYLLPYPGILPDNILYPLKMARDRILLTLTFDPVKKAELLLLFANKRIGASRSLIEGGKIELGVSTLTKGEKYLEQAIDQVKKAEEAGKETKNLYGELAKATLKHQEILFELLSRVPDTAKETIQKAMDYSRQGYETVTRGMEKRN